MPLRATWEPNLSGLDGGGACSLGPASEGSRRSNLEPEQCAPCAGACPAWLRHCEHTPVLFVCSILPFPQHDWTSEPKKKVSTTAPLVSGWKADTEETSKQKKLNRGNHLGSDPTLPTPPEKVPEISLLFLQPFSFLLLLMLLFDCFFFFSFSSPFFNYF